MDHLGLIRVGVETEFHQERTPEHGGFRVDKLLIAGVDTLVGANMAAWLAGKRQVSGACWKSPFAIEGCDFSVIGARESPLAWISREQPDGVVFCGPGADSSWGPDSGLFSAGDWSARASEWATAAAKWNADFTLISSDAIFTGPWMFHRETGNCFCDTPRARTLRSIEQSVLEANSDALVIRTNAFGWSPFHDRPGFVEHVLDALSMEQPVPLDCLRHATPILATDLADIVDEARIQKLSGIYHVGGGERINPFRFACLLADQFDLPLSGLEACDTRLDGMREFGRGETSLQGRKVKKTIHVALPLIREGISRLYEQHVSGFRDRFQVESELATAARAA